MLTRKASSLLALAISSIFFGLFLKSFYLVLISVPIVSFVIFSILVGSNRVHTNLLVTRTLSRDSIYEDQKITVTLQIKNLGRKISFLQIIDELPKELTVSSGNNRRILRLAPREIFSFSYDVVPKIYGFHTIGPAVVTVSDTQFMLSEDRKFLEQVSVLKVFPKIQYVPKIGIRPKRTKNWPGEINTRRPGPGMEFYSLREYQPGDPVKRINWKSSSKSAENLFTNQFQIELGGDSIIVLDARTVSSIGYPPYSSDTFSVRAAGIVAHRLLRDRNRVGMIIFGSRLDKVPPGFGKRQFDRILTALAQTKPDTTWEIGNLGGYLSLFFSTMVQIIFISPLIDDSSFFTVTDIVSRGYQILVISPSAIPIEKRLYSNNNSDFEVVGLAERILKTKRDNRLNVLRNSAVVVDWDVDTPLADALHEATLLWNKKRMTVSMRQ